MSNKYDEFHADMREGRKATWRFLPTVIGVSVVLTILGFVLNSLGLFGRTVVERKVFENSYQRSSSIDSQIATDEAALVEINSQLARTDLDAGTRANLEVQASAARVRIAAAKGRK